MSTSVSGKGEFLKSARFLELFDGEYEWMTDNWNEFDRIKTVNDCGGW